MIEVNAFLTGATGYVGGALLAKLVQQYKAGEYEGSVRVLVRNQSKADKVTSWAHRRGVEKLVTPVIGSLESKEVLVSEITRANVLIDAADCDSLIGAKNFNAGLAAAIKAGNHPVLVHTSGTNLLYDGGSGLTASDKIYHDDRDEEINSIEDTVPHRDVDLELFNFHKQHKADYDLIIIAPPTIWGIGAGPDNVLTIQVPTLAAKALELRQAYNVGTGANIWAQVHVVDMADFYFIALNAALKTPGVHSGFYFCENGEFSWKEVAEQLQLALVDAGYTTVTKPLETLDDAAYKTVFGESQLCRWMTAGNSRSRAVKAPKMGWKPRYSTKEGFLAECRQMITFIEKRNTKQGI